MGDTRAKKSGIAAEIEKKVEQRYHEAEENGTTEAIKLWLNSALQGEHDAIPSAEHRDLQRALADGVMLCKLINKLLASEGKKGVSFQKKVGSPFIAMGNSESFCKGLLAYGLDKESQFQGVDLWEGKKAQFLNVVNSLHTLGMAANKKGFEFSYTGQQTEYVDQD